MKKKFLGLMLALMCAMPTVSFAGIIEFANSSELNLRVYGCNSGMNTNYIIFKDVTSQGAFRGLSVGYYQAAFRVEVTESDGGLDISIPTMLPAAVHHTLKIIRPYSPNVPNAWIVDWTVGSPYGSASTLRCTADIIDVQ